MAKVEVYSKTYCPYCVRAKALLDQLGVDYTEIIIDDDEEQQKLMMERTKRRTVPQIIINGQPIGGFDDMAKLHRQGQLKPLLEQPEKGN